MDQSLKIQISPGHFDMSKRGMNKSKRMTGQKYEKKVDKLEWYESCY